MKDRSSETPERAGCAARLPARLAFVVQLNGSSATNERSLSGRVEHILSGEGASFQGGQELLSTIERLLSSVDPKGHAT